MDALKILSLIEIAGFHFIADPTFDEFGDYKLPARHSDQDVTARSFGEATRFSRRDVLGYDTLDSRQLKQMRPWSQKLPSETAFREDYETSS